MYKVKYRKKKRLIKSHLILCVILFLIILICAGIYFKESIKYLNECMDVDVATSNLNRYNKVVIDRLNDSVSYIDLNKISKEAHDEANSKNNNITIECSSEASSLNNRKEDTDYASVSSNVPPGHSFKSFTYYTSLSQHSLQGKLQQSAYTDENGLRKVGDYYCAALGSYYTGNIGDKYIVTLSTGIIFKLILCDVKSDAHTDSNHQFTKNNGCVIEFYVDKAKLNNKVRTSGDISSINGFEGDIISIVKE